MEIVKQEAKPVTELLLKRKWYTHKSTIGELFRAVIEPAVHFIRQCFILEDVVRAPGVKIPGRTAIGAGRYRLVVDYSNRFKKYAFHLLNVANFDGIRIHSGNTDQDTDGCLVAGDERGLDAVLMSHAAFQKLWDLLVTDEGCAWDAEHDCQIFRMKQETWITIMDEPESDTRDPQDVAA